MKGTQVVIGAYIPRDSVLHRMDPRIKWLLTLLLAYDLYRGSQLWDLLPFAVIVLAGLGISRIGWRSGWSALRPVWPLLLLLAFVHLFFDEGQTLWQAGPLHLTREGLTAAGLTTVQFIFLFLSAALLSWTTAPLELAQGLESLFAPLKKIGIPVHSLAMAVVLAYRFFPVLSREWEKIVCAQRARGADFSRGSFLRRMRHLASLVVPLLILTFERAEELSIAMEARCYRGDKGRSQFHKLSLGKKDVFALLSLILLSIPFWM